MPSTWTPPPVPPDLELAWIGGFYSGEGCTGVHAKVTTGRCYLELAVSNTHLPALERCQRALGGRIYPNPRGGTRKPMWQWRIARVEHAAWAAALLRPWLTAEKVEQLDRALARVAANEPADPGRIWRTRRARYGPAGRALAAK